MASNRKKDIDQLFKTNLEKHSSEVHPSLWTKISAELDREDMRAPVDARKWSFNRSWVLKIAAGVLLFGFVIWKVQPEKEVQLMSKKDFNSEISPNIVLEEDGGQEQIPPKSETVTSRAPLSDESESQVNSEDYVAQVQRPRATNNIEGELLEEKKVAVQHLPDEAVLVDTDIALVDVPAEKPILIELETRALTETELSITDEESVLKGEELSARDIVDNLSIANPNDVDRPSSRRGRPKILSGVLNFVANNLQVGGSQDAIFSETDEGILQIEVKALFDK